MAAPVSRIKRRPDILGSTSDLAHALMIEVAAYREAMGPGPAAPADSVACQAAMLVLVEFCRRQVHDPQDAPRLMTALLLDCLTNHLLLHAPNERTAISDAERAAKDFIENFKASAPAYFAARAAIREAMQ